MAYQTGDLILDDHYNGFANTNDPNNVNKIWGTGSGIFGYGQTNTVNTVDTDTTVQASQWNTLLSRMRSSGDHQGTGITTADSGQLATGDPIAAITTISADITTLGNAKTTVADANVTLSNAVTGTRTFTGTWSSAVVHEVKFTFADVDSARYFFNAGGTLRWNGSMNGFTSDPKTLDWENLFETKFNVFSFGATSSSVSGNGTMDSSNNNTGTGYYDLSGTDYNTIFKMFGGQLTYSYYNTNFILIEVKTNGGAGDNAANGNEITIKATMTDAASDDGTAADTMDGNLVSNWGYNKPNQNHLNNDACGTINTAEVSQSQS